MTDFVASASVRKRAGPGGLPGARSKGTPTSQPAAHLRRGIGKHANDLALGPLQRHLPRWLAWAADPEQARRARFLEKAYRPGEIVFQEGDPGRALFVIVEGAVEITQATVQGEYVVRTLGPGDAFGELALIDDFPRSATARVATLGRLLIFYKSDFDALMDGNARIAVVVMRNLSRLLAVYARRTPVLATELAPRPETAGPP